MAFPNRADWWLLTDIGSSWTLWGPPEITLADTGWDKIRVPYVKNFGTTTPAAADLKPKAIGDQLEGLNFWCDGSQPAQLVGNIWLVWVTGVGISGSRPLKVRLHSSSETQQGGAVESLDWVGAQPAVVRESAPSVTIEYVQVGGDPPSDLVGLAGTPAFEPAVRDSVFESIGDPLYHWPSGWVFDDIDCEGGPGNHAWLIREVWNWVFQKSVRS